MLNDERIIEIIAQRMSEECGWSKASTVMNHYGWIDVVTHLYAEKRLRGALIEAYMTEIINARAQEMLEAPETYQEWKADVATRGDDRRDRAEYLEER